MMVSFDAYSRSFAQIDLFSFQEGMVSHGLGEIRGCRGGGGGKKKKKPPGGGGKTCIASKRIGGALVGGKKDLSLRGKKVSLGGGLGRERRRKGGGEEEKGFWRSKKKREKAGGYTVLLACKLRVKTYLIKRIQREGRSGILLNKKRGQSGEIK